MRILEAQNAVLTNVEVYSFLTEQARQYQTEKRRGPANLETVRKEMINYLETYPGPLSQKPAPFNVEAIPVLLDKLRPYNITKGECIMFVNLRPTTIAALNAILEHMEGRYDEQKQEEILGIIIEVLGQFPPQEEGEDDDGDGDGDGDAMETAEDGS
ncbi:HRDC-like protein [Poronia punctata]|nr:HRDC-like protein [Poronia punctata]